MVLIDFQGGVHAAFNPRTCALDMVWKGDVDWKGKVYDFSQSTSQPKSEGGINSVLLDCLSPVELVSSIHLDGDHPRVQLGPVDLSGTSDAWLWFEEVGRKPVRVEINDAATHAMLSWFESATHVTSDSDWQWNLKRLPRTTSTIDIAFIGTPPSKEVRSVRLLTQRVHWTSGAVALETRWHGYRFEKDGSLVLKFEILLASGQPMHVEQSLRATVAGFASSFSGTVPDGVRLDGIPPADRNWEWSVK